jgi:cytochrome b561
LANREKVGLLSTRVAYNFSQTWAVAVENEADARAGPELMNCVIQVQKIVGGVIVQNEIAGREYGFMHKALHWIVFGLIAAQYAVGSIMPHVGRDTKDESWIAWHFEIGSAILFFVLLRLAWKVARPVPLAGMPTWQTRLANFTHVGLYTLILVMTLLGWAANGYRGWTVRLFGIIPFPALAEKGTPWAHTAGDIHDYLVYVLLAFIVLHIVGSLYHHFVLRDRILQRMLPT